jgi:hypothetical protein
MEEDHPKTNSSSSFVFGPVASRRLGRSLEIDLVPLKTCTFNCIYCQLGRTTHPTLDRKAYVPGGKVMEELEEKLSSLSPPPDFITLCSRINAITKRSWVERKNPNAMGEGKFNIRSSPKNRSLFPGKPERRGYPWSFRKKEKNGDITRRESFLR